MTMALCLNCGETKFGAICACPKCQVVSSGDMGLDIAFSDHNYTTKTLTEFGEVIRAIRSVAPSPEDGFWGFIRYVSLHHPSILSVNLDKNIEARVDQMLATAKAPPVVLRSSNRRPQPPPDPNA